MKVEEKTIVEQFVDFVRSPKWHTPETVSVSDIRILFCIVERAGFNPKLVVVGKVKGSYVDQDDANRTQEFYDINYTCPFKVVGQDGTDDRFATGWLNSLFRKVKYPIVGPKKNIDPVVHDAEEEIKRSVPFEPIRLTREGDYLVERHNEPKKQFPYDDYLIDHIRDDNRIFDHKKIHAHCGEELHIRKVTANHHVIVCRACCLRVLIPVGIKTFGELRDWCAHARNHEHLDRISIKRH